MEDKPMYPITAGNQVYNTGITTRDYFAMQALTGLMSNRIVGMGWKYAGDPAYSSSLKFDKKSAVKAAYEIADEILSFNQQSNNEN